uniref:Uncharacterized protein n=1 Tax=Arundo donax TaxID=35708 RepID=A0A0A9B6J8_ARUDO
MKKEFADSPDWQ